MQQKYTFEYNNVPEQKLTYANQLTVKQWNDIINALSTQYNTTTHYVETLHKWLIGEGHNIITIPVEGLSYAQYVLNTLNSHAASLSSHAKTLNSHADRLNVVEDKAKSNTNEIDKIKSGITSVSIAKDYDTQHGTIKNKFEEIQIDYNEKIDNKLNKDFSDVIFGESIGESTEFVIRNSGETKKITFKQLKELLDTGDYHRGYFSSLEILKNTVTDPKAGDYAFVDIDVEDNQEEQEDLIMYIWDNNDKTWRMSGGTQYLKTVAFDSFQKALVQNGTVIPKKSDGYTKEGEIGQKFNQLEKQTIELSDEVENEDSPILRQIKIGGDAWQIKVSEESGTSTIKSPFVESISKTDDGIYYVLNTNGVSETIKVVSIQENITSNSKNLVTSNALYEALIQKFNTSEAVSLGGTADKIIKTNASGLIDSSLLPSIAITDVYVKNTAQEMNSLSAQTGDVCIVVNENKTYIYNGNKWEKVLTPSDSINATEISTLKTTVATNSSEITSLKNTNADIINAMSSFVTSSEVNEMIADYITTNFENGDEGSY